MGRSATWSLMVTSLLVGAAVAGPRYELDGHNLKVPHEVAFVTAKPELRPEAADAIAYVKGYLDDKSYVTLLRIEVHSDGTGSEAQNQALTEQRALAVAKALVAKGVDCKRLVPVGFGSTKPIADTKTAEGKAQNRRVTFANVELRGRVIGGMPKDGGGKIAGSACP